MAVRPRLPPIDTLNHVTPGEFAAALRPLFEATGTLARRLYAGRPYGSYDALLDHAQSVAAHFRVEEQVKILNAHPRIGESAAVVRGLSRLSYREQGYDREVGLPAEEMQRVYAELAELNRTYEDRFGFRFVIFVNKRPKSQIVEVLRERLRNSRATELETALNELFSIARDRCQQLT
jgi:OHCU decarboxylase